LSSGEKKKLAVKTFNPPGKTLGLERTIVLVDIGDLSGAITHATRAVTLPKLAAGGTVVRREKS